MARPSDRWPTLDELDPESEKRKFVEKILSEADFEYLEKEAIKCRQISQRDLPSNVTCRVELKRFGSVQKNVLLEIAFSDGVFWTARVLHQSSQSGSLDENQISVLSEIATMRIVRERTNIPAPEVLGFEMSAEQPFGFPYVFIVCIQGFSLPGGLAFSIPMQHRNKVARRIAYIWMQLQNIHSEYIGRLWRDTSTLGPIMTIPMAWHSSQSRLSTSYEYFHTTQRDRHRDIASRCPDDLEHRTASWVLMNAMNHVIVKDKVQGPFPLCHWDFSRHNIIFNDAYEIIGVTGWAKAQTAPLEQQAACPELVTSPYLSNEQNQSVLEFKKLVIFWLKKHEGGKGAPNRFRGVLPTFLDSKGPEIVYEWSVYKRDDYLNVAKRIAQLLYGQIITWGQLKDVYGPMPFY
ncbi:MAG: hypothetical protein M1820_008267 [Bogoriella megaspora]|nr:MAG: hypothetical protein M1820_008267 [Bogoriella megaspora]